MTEAARQEIPASGSVDPDEVARFEAMADAWWDPAGPFRPLHKLNPVRIGFLRDRIAGHFGRDTRAERPLAGLRILDIGCGGGLVCEPLARLGASVTGIDAAEGNIAIARRHADESGLAIDYRATTAEALAATGARYDAVLALEIVEHVADLDLFVGATCRLADAGGLTIFATLNRTAKSFALAIVGAEYVLGLIPRGTHEYAKLIRPAELAAWCRRAGLEVESLTGLHYNPATRAYRLGGNVDVNYFACAVRAERSAR